jgi:large subunit ribosomal protein L5e
LMAVLLVFAGSPGVLRGFPPPPPPRPAPPPPLAFSLSLSQSNSYFKRFQVKYRRRRSGKTDYKQRRALVIQDKNKYQAPKHRLVVRITNHAVIVQVTKSTYKVGAKLEEQGDHVVAAANSAELKNYGVKVGFKNYTAAYLTGYLAARRVLTSLNMAAQYPGVETPDGAISTTKSEDGKRTFFVPKLDEDRKPFRAFLDVGTRRTTTGSRVFAAMKGAVDGGLDVPHNEKRFPGYIKEAKKYDPDELRNRITGGHVKDFMEHLEGAFQNGSRPQYKQLAV